MTTAPYSINTWVSDNGNWYYFNGDGVMQTGWQQLGNAWYYLESSDARCTVI